jgi:hypothetical protein
LRQAAGRRLATALQGTGRWLADGARELVRPITSRLQSLRGLFRRGNCFTAGTPLLTPDGDKPIEQFQPGDWILSRSEHDPEGPLEARLVEEVFVRVAPVLRLQVGGRVIETTEEHPFYVHGQGWRFAGELKAGDRLCSHDGQVVAVESVGEPGGEVTVYNLRVAEDHTYFVGSREWGFSVWAHNSEYQVFADVYGTYSIRYWREGQLRLLRGPDGAPRRFNTAAQAEAWVAQQSAQHAGAVGHIPGSPAHRAVRWEEYQASFGPGGSREGRTPWSRERWERYYELNMRRAHLANQPVIDYQAQLGWGRRHQEVATPYGVRRLDIVDVATRRGVEVKSGYIRMSPEIRAEITRDAWLVRQRGWDIEYHFTAGSRASQGLLDALAEAGIRVTGL